MKISLFFPSPRDIKVFLAQEQKLDYSYPEVGASQSDGPFHYDNDYNHIVLGRGEEIWERAKVVLREWKQFPAPWTTINPVNAPLREKETVAVLFRIWGLWFTNSARIIYVLDEDSRFGFAYGTLPGHIETGEECFWIEKDGEGKVSYHIRAFSRPRHWLVRLGYPVARWYQKKFVLDSMRQVYELVNRESYLVNVSTKKINDVTESGK